MAATAKEGARLEHARLLNQVAIVFQTNGSDYTKALELYGRALAIYEEVHGKHHPDTAGTYNGMAIAYKKQGDHAKALELYGRALAIKEEVHGKHHPDTAGTYYGMALAFGLIGESTQQREYFGKAATAYAACGVDNAQSRYAQKNA